MSRRTLNTKQWAGTITGSSAVGGEPEITVSSDLPDRTGDRVLPSGADVAHFMANPTLTWAHSRDEIPIGTITHLEIGPKSRIRWRWLEGDPFAARVRNAWEQGIIRASSIEFLPKSGGAHANSHGGYDYSAWELIGVSLVPTPANPEAVRAFKTLGLLPEKAGPTVDWEKYKAWMARGPYPVGVAQGDVRSPQERQLDTLARQQGSRIAQAARTPAPAYEERGAMGTVLPTKEIGDSLPHESRTMTGEEHAWNSWALLRSRGIPLASGPVRSHGPNLGASPLIQFDEADVKAVLRDLAPKIRHMVREAVGRAQPTIDRAIRRARGRID
ncbi:MAG: hypothetical protein HY724_00770 [Candidatus Rokubacteria bacterium]|nr:hypothetical protein [Candidatus Rokubacteria bacterium]